VDYRDFALVAYGGAGPTHAFLLAEEVGITRVLVPPSPGTLCALGCVVMEVRSDFIQSVGLLLDAIRPEQLEKAFLALEQRARGWLVDEQVEVGEHLIMRSADMRYRGQSFEIQVRMPARQLDPSEVQTFFTDAYHRIYGVADPTRPIEVITLRTSIVGHQLRPDSPEADGAAAQESAPRAGCRRIFYRGRWIEAALIQRGDLRQGHAFDGPAIIVQYDTTVFVTPGYRAVIDAAGNLIATRAEAAWQE
jgi:N-methylhydantoinase A